MKSRQSGLTQETAAAKAGVSIRSGRRIEKGEHQLKQDRQWRTRIDPLKKVWDSELVPLLEKEATLTGLTLWEHLDDKYPEQYPYHLLRTLQRRVKHWRATEGPVKDVIIRQSVPVGQQGLSDFTHPRTQITIAGKIFKHLLYQYRLAHSGWRDVHIVQGGESYSALADGLQTALHKAGGVPIEHRTDSLSAAYVNTSEKRQFTELYKALCEHYGLRATTNNLGVSHENGAIETAHRSIKHRIEQAIKLRGSADFASISDYQCFIDQIVSRLNRRCKSRFLEEQRALKPLPRYRFIDYTELSVKVTTSATITVKRGLYTVPSQLIGENLRVHLYHDRLECFVGQTRVIKLRRVYPATPTGRARQINYHHIIHALAAKPQAFRFSRFREDILPNRKYRQLWLLIEQQLPPRDACKWMVSVLRFAADYDCEGTLSNTLLQQQEKRGRLPTLKTIQARYLRHTTPPDIPIRQHQVADYDQLLRGQWEAQGVPHV
ncbi:MAG: IS21 family transposase [Gammaproteobacteria bacterium]